MNINVGNRLWHYEDGELPRIGEHVLVTLRGVDERPGKFNRTHGIAFLDNHGNWVNGDSGEFLELGDVIGWTEIPPEDSERTETKGEKSKLHVASGSMGETQMWNHPVESPPERGVSVLIRLEGLDGAEDWYEVGAICNDGETWFSHDRIPAERIVGWRPLPPVDDRVMAVTSVGIEGSGESSDPKPLTGWVDLNDINSVERLAAGHVGKYKVLLYLDPGNELRAAIALLLEFRCDIEEEKIESSWMFSRRLKYQKDFDEEDNKPLLFTDLPGPFLAKPRHLCCPWIPASREIPMTGCRYVLFYTSNDGMNHADVATCQSIGGDSPMLSDKDIPKATWCVEECGEPTELKDIHPIAFAVLPAGLEGEVPKEAEKASEPAAVFHDDPNIAWEKFEPSVPWAILASMRNEENVILAQDKFGDRFYAEEEDGVLVDADTRKERKIEYWKPLSINDDIRPTGEGPNEKKKPIDLRPWERLDKSMAHAIRACRNNANGILVKDSDGKVFEARRDAEGSWVDENYTLCGDRMESASWMPIDPADDSRDEHEINLGIFHRARMIWYDATKVMPDKEQLKRNDCMHVAFVNANGDPVATLARYNGESWRHCDTPEVLSGVKKLQIEPLFWSPMPVPPSMLRDMMLKAVEQ